MLKFFRTIRKKLIDEDNVRKYLLYAIGEILLVVIGILIALQVNNWNEQRLVENRRIGLLKNIQSDYVRNKARLTEAYNASNLSESSLILIVHLLYSLPQCDNIYFR